LFRLHRKLLFFKYLRFAKQSCSVNHVGKFYGFEFERPAFTNPLISCSTLKTRHLLFDYKANEVLGMEMANEKEEGQKETKNLKDTNMSARIWAGMAVASAVVAMTSPAHANTTSTLNNSRLGTVSQVEKSFHQLATVPDGGLTVALLGGAMTAMTLVHFKDRKLK
jgi:hypothetical protein